MKLTISLLLVSVLVMVSEAVPALHRSARAVQSEREQSIYSAGQATGDNAIAYSDAYEDYFARLASATAISNNGSVAAVSRLNTKEVTTDDGNTDEGKVNLDGEEVNTAK